MMHRDAAAWRDLSIFLGLSPAEAEGIGRAAVDPAAFAEAHPDAADVVASVNGGNQTVPTLLFSDGSSMTNPSASQVERKLAELR